MPTRGEGLISPCCKALHSRGLSRHVVMVISKYYPSDILRKANILTDGFLTQNIMHCRKRKKIRSTAWDFHVLRDICPSSKEIQNKDSKESSDRLIYEEQKLSLPLSTQKSFKLYRENFLIYHQLCETCFKKHLKSFFFHFKNLFLC